MLSIHEVAPYVHEKFPWYQRLSALGNGNFLVQTQSSKWTVVCWTKATLVDLLDGQHTRTAQDAQAFVEQRKPRAYMSTV